MKSLLYGIEASLLFGLAVATDGIEAQYGMRVWIMVAFGAIGLAVLLAVIADLVPNRPRRRRRRRAEGHLIRHGCAVPPSPRGEGSKQRERVATLRPADEEERVWF